jgi:hypothetical protein
MRSRAICNGHRLSPVRWPRRHCPSSLGVSSAAPTWRDASAALWILSGVYLILQAILSFGFGGYIAGRVRRPVVAGPAEEVESRDGLHGLAVWAMAVVLGSILAALVGASTLSRSSLSATNASAAEPLLSYELDRLYRPARRPPNVDLSSDRAEAGRILLTASGHDGMSADDRAYLIQQVSSATGLSLAEAERRVDNVIANSKTPLVRARVPSSWLFRWRQPCCWERSPHGPRRVWAAGTGMVPPLPEWMIHSNRLERRRVVLQ